MNRSHILILLLIVVMKVLAVFNSGSAGYEEAPINSVGSGQNLSAKTVTAPSHPAIITDTLYLGNPDALPFGAEQL